MGYLSSKVLVRQWRKKRENNISDAKIHFKKHQWYETDHHGNCLRRNKNSVIVTFTCNCYVDFKTFFFSSSRVSCLYLLHITRTNHTFTFFKFIQSNTSYWLQNKTLKNVFPIFFPPGSSLFLAIKQPNPLRIWVSCTKSLNSSLLGPYLNHGTSKTPWY